MHDMLFAVAALAALGCGGQSAKTAVAPRSRPTATDAPTKPDPCVGFDMDLGAALMQAACEVPDPKPDQQGVDMTGKLAVTLVPSAAIVSPGDRVDLTLTLTNKGKAPLPLYFTLDPTPRFPIEAYDKKGRRVDMPSSHPPPLPKGMAPREATEHETARITLVPNGTAKLTVPWQAVRMKWAPKKLKGTPPEEGYPRVPAGPLPRGTYTVRVATPMVLVFEGSGREISAPKATVVVR